MAIVQCYSGHTYAQEPRSFEWEGREYVVERILSMRRVLDAASGSISEQFVVATNAGPRFHLAHTLTTDTWRIEPLPSSAGAAPAA